MCTFRRKIWLAFISCGLLRMPVILTLELDCFFFFTFLDTLLIPSSKPRSQRVEAIRANCLFHISSTCIQLYKISSVLYTQNQKGIRTRKYKFLENTKRTNKQNKLLVLGRQTTLSVLSGVFLFPLHEIIGKILVIILTL